MEYASCDSQKVHFRSPTCLGDTRYVFEGIQRRNRTLAPRLFEILEPRVPNMRACGLLYLFLDGLFLLLDKVPRFEVFDRKHRALHDRSALVVLDVPDPHRPIQSDVRRKSLFLKVPDGVVVGVGKEMLDIKSILDVVLELGHETRAVALDLLRGRDGTKDNFGKTARSEWPVRDASDDLERVLDHGHAHVVSAYDEDETRMRLIPRVCKPTCRKRDAQCTLLAFSEVVSGKCSLAP